MTVLIVGSNRGIGLEMTRQFKARGETVIAACRTTSDALDALGVEVIEGVDVASDASMNDLKASLDGRSIDCVMVVAGVLKMNAFGDLDFEQMKTLFDINSIGPLRVAQAVNGNLSSAAKIGLITSRMGSIADNTSGGGYAYRMSKAALNAGGKSLALDLADSGVSVAILHPGWVKTDMTNNNGLIDVRESAEGLIARMDELTPETSGTFWHVNGDVLPW